MNTQPGQNLLTRADCSKEWSVVLPSLVPIADELDRVVDNLEQPVHKLGLEGVLATAESLGRVVDALTGVRDAVLVIGERIADNEDTGEGARS